MLGEETCNELGLCFRQVERRTICLSQDRDEEEDEHWQQRNYESDTLLRLNDARVVERTSQEDDCQYG